MPLHIGRRNPRHSSRFLLALIRSRFLKATHQKALRDRARVVAGDLIGRPAPAKRA